MALRKAHYALARVIREKRLTGLSSDELAQRLGVTDAKSLYDLRVALAFANSPDYSPIAKEAGKRQARILAAKNAKGEVRANPFTSNLPRYQRARRDAKGRELPTPVNYAHLPVDRLAGVNNEIDSRQIELNAPERHKLSKVRR